MTVQAGLPHGPFKSIDTIPYKLWKIKDREFFKVYFTSHLNGKLGLLAKKCVFLEYSKESKRYVFLEENKDDTLT